MTENEPNEAKVTMRRDKLTATRNRTTGKGAKGAKIKLPKWLIPASTGAVCLVAGAAIAILASDIEPDAETSTMKTSAAPGFQGATGLEGMQIAKPATEPATPPETAPDSDEVQHLRAMVDDLEGKLQELRDNPKQVMVADEAALQNLKTELSKMKDAVAAKDAHAQDLELEISRLETKIETNALLAEQQSSDAEAERQRQEEIEQRRAEAEALEQEKINSPVHSLRRGGNSEKSAEENRYKGDEAFIRAGAESSDVTRSQVIANPGNTVPQGTLIEATLQTGISSDLAGNVTAVISYDVWSFDMANVLIPRGSKLFGRYSSDIKTGQNRLLVAWDRLTTPDGQSVMLDAYGADRLGRSGLTGKVDNHFFSRFGSAALISIIGGAPSAAANNARDKTESEVAKNVADDFSGAVDDVIAETLRRPPTLTIEHGSVVTVIVNTDLELF